jgi:hypothetical protein
VHGQLLADLPRQQLLAVGFVRGLVLFEEADHLVVVFVEQGAGVVLLRHRVLLIGCDGHKVRQPAAPRASAGWRLM